MFNFIFGMLVGGFLTFLGMKVWPTIKKKPTLPPTA